MVHRYITLLKVNDSQWSMLILLSPHLLCSVLWMPCSFTLLSLYLYYMTIQNLVYRYKNLHMITFANIKVQTTHHIQHALQISEIIIQLFKQLWLNKRNMCSSLWHDTLLYETFLLYHSMCHFLKLRHRWCTGMNTTTLQDD